MNASGGGQHGRPASTLGEVAQGPVLGRTVDHGHLPDVVQCLCFQVADGEDDGQLPRVDLRRGRGRGRV